MERDLSGFPVPSDYQISSRRDALDMAAAAEQAIAAGKITPRRIDPVDLAGHKPQSKWTRKDGMTGQRETWQRQLSGHRANQKRYGKNETAPSGAPAAAESQPHSAGTATAFQEETGHRPQGLDEVPPSREVEGLGRQPHPSAKVLGESSRPNPFHAA